MNSRRRDYSPSQAQYNTGAGWRDFAWNRLPRVPAEGKEGPRGNPRNSASENRQLSASIVNFPIAILLQPA